MKKSNQYRVNSPSVIHEMIDDEVVIVNLEKGRYYSLLRTGAEIWAGISEGMASDDIILRLSNQYEADRKVIEMAVNNLISELQKEGVIIPIKPGDRRVTVPNENVSTDNKSGKQKFEIPKLEKYTDMEELLLLDPIHDIDEMGWPNMALDATEKGE
jgi:hypothetical protein